MIAATNISKYFGNLQVLKDVSFTADTSAVTSVIGPSGSGKTTLLRCITGLDLNYSGNVVISGAKQQDYLSGKRIAFVTQQYSNFPWMTVRQNIASGLRKAHMSDTESRHTVAKLICDLQLEGFADYYISKLSGGMRQRVAIGRALAQDTEFLAMDEPLGALDYQTRENLQLLIKKINEQYHKTILFVTHDIEEAIFLSDKIILLSRMPSRVVSEYTVPLFAGENSGMCRFEDGFVALRKTIETDLKKINAL